MLRLSLSLILFAIVVTTVSGLVTGADWMIRAVPGWPALPLGNLASWLAMIATAGLVRLWAPAGPWVARANVLLALALAWLPLSRLLAGNWGFNFDGGPGWSAWRAITAGLAFALVGSLLAVLVARITGRRTQER